MQQARRTLLIITLLITGLFYSAQRLTAAAAEPSHASEILQYVREDKVYLLEKIRRQITKPSEKMVVDGLLSEDGPRAASLYRKQLTEYPDPLMDPISRSRLAAYVKAVSTPAAPPAIPAKYSTAARQAPVAAPAITAPVASRPDSSARKLTTPPAAKPATVTKTVAPTGKAEPTTRTTAQAAAKAQPSEKPTTTPKTESPAPAKAALTSGFTLQFGSFDSVANANHLAAQLSASAPASVQKINGIYKVRLKNIFATREEAVAFGRTLPIESFVVTIQP
ncbi:MAG: SPOR domain-containing protein [Chlorobiaceae bacterium]|nr:SPOR domain-containing protein [Chlorobiaceae bacterium]